MRKSRRGFGQRDGSQRGRQAGGRGRNQTNTCRHPRIKKNRK